MPALEDAVDTSSFDPEAYLAERDAGTSSTDGFDPEAYLAERDAQNVPSTDGFDPEAYLAERAAQKVAAANPDVAATTQAVATTPAKTEVPAATSAPAGYVGKGEFAPEANVAPIVPRQPGQTSVDSFKKAMTEPAVTFEPIKIEQSDSELTKIDKTQQNLIKGFVSGATSPAGALALLSPFMALSQIATSAPDIIKKLEEAEQTPAGSPERHEAAAETIATILPFAIHGMVKSLKGKPNASQVTSPESVPVQPEGGTVGEGTPLRQQGEIAPESPATEIAQPQTATEPVNDPIVAAANKAPDGSIFTGREHFESSGKAHDAGFPKTESGFVTKSGKFLTPEEAHDHVLEQGQMTKQDFADHSPSGKDEGWLDATWLPETGPSTFTPTGVANVPTEPIEPGIVGARKQIMGEITARPVEVMTEDGFTFKKQPDGSWGDGDASWSSYDDMTKSLKDDGIRYVTNRAPQEMTRYEYADEQMMRDQMDKSGATLQDFVEQGPVTENPENSYASTIKSSPREHYLKLHDEIMKRKSATTTPKPETAPVTVEAYRGEGDANLGGEGHQFYSESADEAGRYGKVKKETLTFQNPLETENWMSAKKDLGLPESAGMDTVLNSARDAGHDGIIWQHHGKTEYVKLKPESAPVEAPAASGEPAVTGTKNEVTAAERESRGIAPAEEAAARDFGTVWDEATATAEKDPAAPQRLVESLSEKPRAVSDSENALLLRRQIEVQNEHDAAVKAVNDNPGDAAAVERLDKVRDDLQTIYDVNKSVGRETGRGLNARKMLAAQDFSLAKMESEYRAVANEGKPLSEVQTKEVAALHERIKLAEGKLAAYESRGVFNGALKDARGAKRPFSPVKFLAEQEIAARARILERRGKLYADPIGIQSVAHLADEAIIGASHLARGIKTFGEWSGAMIKDFGEGIKPYLKALFAKSRDIHTQASRLAAAKSRTVTETVKTMSRIGAEDYTPRKVEKIKPDEQLFELRGNLEKARSVYRGRLMERKLAAQTPLQKAGRYTRDVLDISRALKTSFDVSAVLRQGGILAASHPIIAARNLKPMFKALASEKAQLAKMEEIKARSNFPRYNRSGLELTEPGGPLSHQEEVFRSRFAQKIPGVAMSERAYVTFLDSERADAWDALANSLERKGKPMTLEEEKIISNYINVASGRGPLGKFKDAAVALNSVFFAPRWAASRFQYLLGQPLLRDLGNGSPRVRALVAKEYAKTLIGMGTVLGLGIWAGGTVETQPTSPDLGKLKYGNTRLDMMGALPQAAVFISREARAAKRFASGSTEKYPESERGGDVLWRFLRGKLAPIPGEVVNAQQGKNVVGQPVTPKSAVWNLIAPLSYSDVSGALADQGLEKGAILSLMGLFGAGLQTYQKKESAPTDTAPLH